MKKALVVDDSRAMRVLLDSMLSEHDFDIEACESGESALQALRDGSAFDLITIDWNMPDMSGLTFISRMSDESLGGTAKKFMITTEDSLEVQAQSEDVGCDAFITKPFTFEQLAATLSRFF